LETSIMDAKRQNPEIIYAFLHYPPIFESVECPEIVEVLEKHHVAGCFYGHLHASSIKTAFNGIRNDIRYRLISADALSFTPLLIADLQCEKNVLKNKEIML